MTPVRGTATKALGRELLLGSWGGGSLIRTFYTGIHNCHDNGHWRVMVMNVMLMTMTPKVKQVPAGEFKARCLALFNEVETKRRSFVVTKRGRPVARVVPLPMNRSSSLLGSLINEEDLLAPVEAAWEALH